MHFHRNLLSISTLAVLCFFSCDGCQSGKQQAATQPSGGSTPQVQQNSQPSASGQPSGGQAGETSSAPPGQTSSAQPGQPPSDQSTQAAPAPQPPPPPAVIDLPVGTHLHVRLDQDLGSRISHPGDSFGATVSQPVVANGQTVIPKGAHAEGTVIDAKPLGHFKGGAVLELRLERVHTRWGSYPVATSSIERAEQGKGKRTGEFAGGGGAFGAIIGGIAGGGKGALIGGLAGAGAGTAGSAFTGNKEIFLPAETLLTFRLEHSVHITQSQ
jgi:hypothetical protein